MTADDSQTPTYHVWTHPTSYHIISRKQAILHWVGLLIPMMVLKQNVCNNALHITGFELNFSTCEIVCHYSLVSVISGKGRRKKKNSKILALLGGSVHYQDVLTDLTHRYPTLKSDKLSPQSWHFSPKNYHLTAIRGNFPKKYIRHSQKW